MEAVHKAGGERARFGRFFYRFPSGESGMDVYQRATRSVWPRYIINGDYPGRILSLNS